MDISKLTVGQEVLLFGVGCMRGKVVSLGPSIAVQTDGIGLLQFDEKGRETDQGRYLRCGAVMNGPCPSLLPWEIVATTPEEIAAWKQAHNLSNLEYMVGNVITQLEAGKVEFAKSCREEH
jgi:hypothetical protein